MDNIITVQEFKEFFFRDFPYAEEDKPDDLSKIINKDIEKAIDEASMSFNKSLWTTEKKKKTAFLYVTAYYLVVDIKNAQTGLASSTSGLLSSKSVGDVSESYTFPTWVLNSPMLSQFMDNGYGKKYLSLVYPLLKANTIGLVYGRTTID